MSSQFSLIVLESPLCGFEAAAATLRPQEQSHLACTDHLSHQQATGESLLPI